MYQINIVNPRNVGWLEKKLSTEEMSHIWKCIDDRGKKKNYELAGNIETSNELIDKDDWFWLNTLEPLCWDYINHFENLGRGLPIDEHKPYELKTFWVNYQNQNEFNPPHNHTGIYSFVVWMKIPTRHKEQNNLPISADSNTDVISSFQFTYIDIVGRVKSHKYEMNPEMEGTMLFFPSSLEHQVFPFFNCDEQRISVSGNIFLKL